ncbi:hypothetical protein IV102_04205 [bacterium]|nr:hypothetical protein [bacterium]
MKKFLVVLLLGAVLGGLLVLVTVGYLRYSGRPTAPPAALTVNGQTVAMADFERQLQASAGSALLRQLVEQKLIEQEAARQKITLTPAESESLEKTLKPLPTPLQAGARQQGRAALLAQHLLLQGVSQKERQEVYDFYRPQLTQYEIFIILVATRKDARDVARSLEDGVGFNLLAQNYSLDPSLKDGGRLGFLTMPQIRRYMGEAAATSVARLKPHQVGGAVYCSQGLVVIKLGEVRSSYEQLKPSIEAILADSKKVDLVYRLMSNAEVTSPFLQGPPSAVPQEEARGIVPTPASLPKPIN